MESLYIPCAFHENEYLTNFCQCQQCMLPLCPTCIKIHTEEHITMKSNPLYENINDVIYQVQNNVSKNIEKFDQNHQNIADLQMKVQQMKIMINNNIEQFKSEIMKEVNTYFALMKEFANNQISSMNYTKALKQYKQRTKSHILDLKLIQKGLADDSKVVRTIIKYKSQKLPQLLNTFNKQVDNFVTQLDKNSVIFSVRQDFKQSLKGLLQNVCKFSLQDIKQIIYPIQINGQLKEIIQKDEIKKDIRRSIQNILNSSSNHNSKVNLSQDQSIDGRRRSLSKGKGGLTVLQQFSTCLNNIGKKSLANTNKIRRIGDMSHDSIQFQEPNKVKITTQAYRRMR